MLDLDYGPCSTSEHELPGDVPACGFDPSGKARSSWVTPEGVRLV